MNCPYCGSHVKQVVTGNGMSGNNELVVCEEDEAYDADVSLFQCGADSKHLFYADDLLGNGVAGLPEKL